jgi:uncharacterized protein YggE
VSEDHIRLTGTARRSLAPTAVTWRADAVEHDEDPRAAFDRCTARLNELSERLAAVGEVSTSAVTVQPDWEQSHQPTRTQAVAGVRVRADVDRAGEAAEGAMAAGADRLDGPRYVYDDAEAAREQLLDDAMADARRKAERLAAAAGRRLGRVQSVETESDDRHIVELSASSGPDVIAREQTVTAAVTVVFALED